jgi:hypothetical protein
MNRLRQVCRWPHYVTVTGGINGFLRYVPQLLREVVFGMRRSLPLWLDVTPQRAWIGKRSSCMYRVDPSLVVWYFSYSNTDPLSGPQISRDYHIENSSQRFVSVSQLLVPVGRLSTGNVLDVSLMGTLRDGRVPNGNPTRWTWSHWEPYEMDVSLMGTLWDGRDRNGNPTSWTCIWIFPGCRSLLVSR